MVTTTEVQPIMEELLTRTQDCGALLRSGPAPPAHASAEPAARRQRRSERDLKTRWGRRVRWVWSNVWTEGPLGLV
ncbi:unnamed protein product [Gadus morhua 'NCC']